MLAGDHTRLGKEVSTATPPLIIVFSLAGDHTRLGRLSQKSENQQKFSNVSLLSTLLNTRATMTLAVENFYPAGIETRISQMEETTPPLINVFSLAGDNSRDRDSHFADGRDHHTSAQSRSPPPRSSVYSSLCPHPERSLRRAIREGASSFSIFPALSPLSPCRSSSALIASS